MFSQKLFLKEIEESKAKGIYNPLPVLQNANGAEIMLDGQKMVNLSSNNYLGLVDHPEVKAAAIKAIEKYGVGASSARNIIGNTDLYEELELKLAKFKNEEAALVFQSGFAVNLGSIPVIAGEGDLIISDELNHASIIDGTRLSKAKKIVIRHMNMEDLEKKLKENRAKYKRVLIATDSVFSMDGDIAPLPDMTFLAEKYDSLLYVDDAHGTGILGEKGRGIADYFGLTGKIDFTVGTLSKAIPAVGGYIVGSNLMKDWLKRNARPILFSTSIPSSAIAAAIKVIELLEKSEGINNTLWENTNYFKEGLTKRGINIGNSKTPITPVMIGDEEKAKNFSQKLKECNILASSITFPVVPKGEARVRCIITANHTKQQLDYCIDNIERIAKEMRVII